MSQVTRLPSSIMEALQPPSNRFSTCGLTSTLTRRLTGPSSLTIVRSASQALTQHVNAALPGGLTRRSERPPSAKPIEALPFEQRDANSEMQAGACRKSTCPHRYCNSSSSCDMHAVTYHAVQHSSQGARASSRNPLLTVALQDNQ